MSLQAAHKIFYRSVKKMSNPLPTFARTFWQKMTGPGPCGRARQRSACWGNDAVRLTSRDGLRLWLNVMSSFLRAERTSRLQGTSRTERTSRSALRNTSLKKSSLSFDRKDFLVRETGLEPVRLRHTHLKRACLPVPALSLNF